MIRAALLWLLLLATLAHAGSRETAEAQRRVEQGNKLYEAGRYEDALRLYLAAYDLAPNPDTLFNIALAHEKLLAFEQCVIVFRRYIAQSSDAATKERAAERSARCLERARVAVEVSSIPPGAAVSLVEGGTAATFHGRTPAKLDLAPGSYHVKVEMAGYVSMEQTVTVDVGDRPEIDFPLEKLSSIAIEADPVGATVQLDDGPPAATPFRRELRAGTYKIHVHKEGYYDTDRDVTIGAGEQQTLVMTLRTAPAVRKLAIQIPPHGELEIDGRKVVGTLQLVSGEYRAVARAPGHVPFVGQIAIPRERGTILDVDLPAERSRVQTTALWTLVGLSAAALVGGATYGAMAASAQSDFSQMPSLALADQGTTYAHRADLLFGLSITTAAAAAVSWWLTRPRPSHVEVR